MGELTFRGIFEVHPNDLKTLAAVGYVGLPAASWLVASQKIAHIDLLHSGGFRGLAQATLDNPVLWGSALAGGIAAAGLGYVLSKVEPTFTGAAYTKFLRGTQMVAPSVLRRRTSAGLWAKHKAGLKRQVKLATIPIPFDTETRHILLNGSTGTGKSTIMAALAFDAIMRGDRLVVLDAGGALLSRFGRTNDKILNPYDARTQGWSIFNEIRADYDYERYTMSVIPVAKSDEGEEWAEFGRLLVREIMRKLVNIGQATMRNVLYWATEASFEDLRAFLDGTLGASLFAGSSEASRALTSARFVVSKKLTQHAKMPLGHFSIRDWLADDDAGNLWITWREDMAPALRPLISAWTDVVCTSMLSLPETRHNQRRLWLFIDELGSLEKLASLLDALTKGRKSGQRVVAGLQAVSQMDKTYGREDALTLRATFRSLVVLGGSRTDTKTCEEMSLALGHHEVERPRRSRSIGHHYGVNTSSERVRERVVSPDEIANLPDLRAYVALSGGYPITRVKVPVRDFARRVTPFVEGQPFQPAPFELEAA